MCETRAAIPVYMLQKNRHDILADLGLVKALLYDTVSSHPLELMPDASGMLKPRENRTN